MKATLSMVLEALGNLDPFDQYTALNFLIGSSNKEFVGYEVSRDDIATLLCRDFDLDDLNDAILDDVVDSVKEQINQIPGLVDEAIVEAIRTYLR